MKKKADLYSPNAVLGACVIAAALLVVVCGRTLWVPAARIGNLHVRSVALAAADAGAAFAAWTGFDGGLPASRKTFLAITGLSDHVDWDARYFNMRDRPRPSADLDESGDASAKFASVPAAAEPVSDGIIQESGSPEDSLAAPESGFVSQSPAPRDFSTLKAEDLPSVPGLSGSETQVSPVYEPKKVSYSGASRFSASRNMSHSAANPLNVFMFGDSQVFSLGSGLSRLAGKDGPISVDFLPVHSSGFIRGDYFNWPAKLDDTFRNGSYEAAVMMLGMNDYQNFWSAKGEILKKGTPAWESAYKEKCRSIIDIALASVPRLYWIGMPLVRNPAYSESLAYIDAVQQSLADEYSPDVLVRVSLRDTIPGNGAAYADYAEIAQGKKIRVMSDDGSHFTVEGGQIAMNPLFERLSRDYLFSEVPVAHLPE